MTERVLVANRDRVCETSATRVFLCLSEQEREREKERERERETETVREKGASVLFLGPTPTQLWCGPTRAGPCRYELISLSARF